MVDVHQVVRDREGRVLTDQMLQHIYVIQDGLIRKMEIRKRSSNVHVGRHQERYKEGER